MSTSSNPGITREEALKLADLITQINVEQMPRLDQIIANPDLATDGSKCFPVKLHFPDESGKYRPVRIWNHDQQNAIGLFQLMITDLMNHGYNL